jgi:hypothetical protein
LAQENREKEKALLGRLRRSSGIDKRKHEAREEV